MPHNLNLDSSFAALADPTRRAILARLALGEATVGELAQPFDISGPAISKHLKVLERAGLIRRCRLEAAPMKDAVDWLEGFRRFYEGSLDRLEIYLEELKEKGPGHD